MTRKPATLTTSAGEGSFAVVTYLPDPLGAFLTDLRYALAADNEAEAHITFLPPRCSLLDSAKVEQELGERLSVVRPFVIALGDLMLFKETGMLYLGIQAGHDEILRLHGLLNQGELHADEPFEFVPHLTIAGPLRSGEVDGVYKRAKNAWSVSGIEPAFTVRQLMLLWQPNEDAEAKPNRRKSWNRVATFSLHEAASAVPRG